LGLQEKENTLDISKIYLLSSYRKLAIGKTALKFVDAVASKKSFEIIELIVNRKIIDLQKSIKKMDTA
jgi:predicted acetyltransferase